MDKLDAEYKSLKDELNEQRLVRLEMVLFVYLSLNVVKYLVGVIRRRSWSRIANGSKGLKTWRVGIMKCMRTARRRRKIV
jgi:hypothetical protein